MWRIVKIDAISINLWITFLFLQYSRWRLSVFWTKKDAFENVLITINLWHICVYSFSFLFSLVTRTKNLWHANFKIASIQLFTQLFSWLKARWEQNLIEIKSASLSWWRWNVVVKNKQRLTLKTVEKLICTRWMSRKKLLSKKRNWNSEKLFRFSLIKRCLSDI